MNKTKRFLIVLAVLAVAFAFLFPSVQWYYLTPKEDQALALGSREQIRDYAWRMARTDYAEIEKLALAKDENPLQSKYAYAITLSKKAYKALKLATPAVWNAKGVLAAYDKREDVIADLEGYYRNKILKLKTLNGNSVKLGLDLSGGMSIVIRADIEALQAKSETPLTDADKADAVSRAVEVLNNRIDKFGLTEPVIRTQGKEHVYVEIPGAADPERINGIIMGKGRLAFHIIDDDASAKLDSYLTSNPNGVDEKFQALDPTIVPQGKIIRKFFRKDSYGLDEWTGTYRVMAEVAGLDGNHIQSATTSSDPITGQPNVIFNLDAEGAEMFYKLTSENVGKSMAVVMDDRIKAGARISEAIRDSVRITGFNAEEAQNLALTLRTGALPVELIVESQQAIGASLGEDSIAQGTKAVIIAVLAVFIFMFIYYKGAGLNATIAQVLNLFLMLSILSAFKLTLTLPSIAGFVLTLGMAVDANVIIFERIKDELRLGKGRRASVDAGFHKAFWAIFDSNLTTIIAALFLAQLGTSAIKGFAISLAIGNISSLFTALFVSRLLFDFNTDLYKKNTMSIGWGVK